MSDFDERLSAVLTTEADHAPHPAGLAQAARRRHVVRRRRSLAVGGVAAVLAIAVPVTVLAGGGEGDDHLVGADQPSSGEWQTTSEEDAAVAVPGDWSRYHCEFDGFEHDVYGPSSKDACEYVTYLAFYGSATFDPFARPGVLSANEDADVPGWAGYVYAGDWAVSASTPDRDLTRRILASARVDGQPEVDAAEWESVEGVGLRVDLPTDWGLGPDVAPAEYSRYAVCSAAGERSDPPDLTDRVPGSEKVDLTTDFRDGRWIVVSAPTQAVADLVMASVESVGGSGGIGCLPEDRFTR